MSHKQLLAFSLFLSGLVLTLVFATQTPDDNNPATIRLVTSGSSITPFGNSNSLNEIRSAEPLTAATGYTDPLELSKDLRATFEKNKDAQDAARQQLAYRAWRTCMPNFAGPAADHLRRQMQTLADNTPQKIAYRQLTERCKNFDQLSSDEILQQQQTQQTRWSGGAVRTAGEQATQFLQQDQYTAAIQAANAALKTRNPQALESLRGFVGTYLRSNSLDEEQQATLSIRAQAFTLAACQLGYPCMADSLAATEQCVYSGICEGNLRERLLATLPHDASGERQRRQLFSDTDRILQELQKANPDIQTLLKP
ncbi:hypothetical protein [Undibacterium sp. WLHG33]|uniref:hypothetical protein n=1 Tax=Undibacterium sp. WLHG33 TaxID=3412482 RepID=UPI003C30E9D2